jgi:antitoxin MazE
VRFVERVVRARVVRIGNSRGIRIPKVWIDLLRLGDEVELSVQRDRLMIRRARMPRAEWSAAFERMAQEQDDRLLDQPAATKWDKDEWEW